MRPLTFNRGIGLLAACAMLIAACGGNAATTAPATPTTGPAATEIPGGSPGFSFDLSSFHGDLDLEAMIPATIGGQKLTVVSMTGDQFLGDGSSSPELAAALQKLNKSTTDLSVAFAGTSAVSVVAFRVKGVSAETLFTAFKDAQTDGMTSTSATYGGKSVQKLDSSDGTTAFVYLKDDTMFVIGGNGSAVPTDDVLNEAFQQLP